MVRSSHQSNTKRKRKSNDLIWARDGDHIHAKEHPAYILENCNEDDDTTNSDKVWVEWSSNGTIACIPKSRISSTDLSSRRRRSNNDDNNDTSGDSIQQIIVEGCGMPEINGTYARNETSQRGLVHSADDRGASVFSKKGEWKGEEVDFVIYRTSSDWWWQWCISIGYDILLYKTKDNTYAPHMPPPPLHGWEVMGSGVDPAPTIKYKHQIATDNITSSVSSKVKKEYHKEETNGGDTDDEDKKIAVAAVPTPVVSSQLKKGKYDEDTDEDIAPDPVESTRVSVKAEAEEDTDEDEGRAPDSMLSSQLKKEENDEESTDDEVAPDPVQSTWVKEEDKKRKRKPDTVNNDDDRKLSAVVKTEEIETDNGEEESRKDNTDTSKQSINIKQQEAVTVEVKTEEDDVISSGYDPVKSEETDDEELGTEDTNTSNELQHLHFKVYMICYMEGCYRSAADSGTCFEKHNGYKHCSQDGCTRKAMKGGFCRRAVYYGSQVIHP